MTDEDVWGTDSGIITDYEGTIVDSFFLKDTQSQFGDPQTQFRVKIATDDDRVVEERWNCGPDWVSNDGGGTVEHPTKKKFNKNAQMGKFVDAFLALGDDAVSVVRGRGTPPTTASTWLGLRFFMEATTSTGKNRTTGEDWTSTKNYPTKFLGVGAAEGGEVQATTPTVVGSPIEKLTADNVAKVTLLAKTLPFGEWVDKVMEIEEVLANEDLIVLLVDDSESGLYNTLKGK